MRVGYTAESRRSTFSPRYPLLPNCWPDARYVVDDKKEYWDLPAWIRTADWDGPSSCALGANGEKTVSP